MKCLLNHMPLPGLSVKAALAALVTFCLLVSPVRAVVVEDLYTIELPVADQTTAQRLETFEQAFSDVLIKISGLASVLQMPEFSRPIKNSSRYVQQYSYLIRKDDNPEVFDAGQMFLRVTFNQEMVENLLRENTIPVWGKQRPNTLLMLSYEVNGSVSLVSSDTTSDIVELLDQQAQKRGLPVLFPLMDLEDRLQIGVQDVMQRNKDNLDKVSARYGPDALLVGRLIGESGKGWKGSWQLGLADKVANWEYKASNREDVIAQLMSELSRILASEYALVAYQTVPQDVMLSVDEVHELTDQVRLKAYLDSLEAIKTVRLVKINQDRVTYSVTMHNSTEDLTRLIGLGNVIEQLELPQIDAMEAEQVIQMSYRLIR